ncbi:peptidase M48 family [Methanobrevibacter ruminantium M1]|uniref:Protease HtpX homolog n=1 Tax=Methanobrevibacter ruminantium (strain ATCC 35063 / DSM 1093 / JCM 13430 / OCM 146 / M1) TaxID=634498 RepID=D3E367_METRM|nr:zinc metalloprotease HtpX [Methanobrevibacter ruminantium]ADC46978.1 peptidase M48 family [Methanobrevibacter ruminantium M1]
MKGTWKLKLRLWLSMAVMFGLVYVLIMLAGNFLGYRGFYGFYAIAGLFVLFLQYIFGPKIVESSMGVHYLSESEAPELHQMVAELAQAANIPKPKVGISNTMVPNAFAYGRSKRSGHVCVTKGILGLLDHDELKAVLGHEISHIKHNDMAITTVVSAIPLICYYLGFSLIFSGGGGDNNNGGGALIGFLALIAYFLGQLIVLFISRVREYYADAGSVELGCQPEKLASALYKLVYGAARIPEQEIKDVEGTKAFFLTDISNARNEINDLSQLDFNRDGVISKEELDQLKNNNVKISGSNKIMEMLSTHPDMLKRIKRLADMN